MAFIDSSVTSQDMSKLEEEIQYNQRPHKSKHRGPKECVRRSTQVVQRLLNPPSQGFTTLFERCHLWSFAFMGLTLYLGNGTSKSNVRAGSSPTTEILSPTNAACSTYSNVRYSTSYWQPLTVREDDMATCLVQDLGLALVVITCPHRPQAFKKVNDDQALP